MTHCCKLAIELRKRETIFFPQAHQVSHLLVSPKTPDTFKKDTRWQTQQVSKMHIQATACTNKQRCLFSRESPLEIPSRTSENETANPTHSESFSPFSEKESFLNQRARGGLSASAPGPKLQYNREKFCKTKNQLLEHGRKYLFCDTSNLVLVD
jgi:hypothetical protein